MKESIYNKQVYNERQNNGLCIEMSGQIKATCTIIMRFIVYLFVVPLVDSLIICSFQNNL